MKVKFDTRDKLMWIVFMFSLIASGLSFFTSLFEDLPILRIILAIIAIVLALLLLFRNISKKPIY